MPTQLLVDTLDDASIVEHVFLMQLLREHLTDREHAVLAMRMSKYTRATIATLLGVGRTTVYTAERDAIRRLQQLYRYEERLEDTWKDTSVSSAGEQLPGDSPSAPNAKPSTEKPAASGPAG